MTGCEQIKYETIENTKTMKIQTNRMEDRNINYEIEGFNVPVTEIYVKIIVELDLLPQNCDQTQTIIDTHLYRMTTYV